MAMNNIEKKQVNGHYVWVDKDVETMTNTPIGYCYNSLKSESDWEDKDIVLHQGTMPIYHFRGLQKIIAASPELNLEGVPSYVEWLAWKDEGRKCLDAEFLRAKFIKGYQTAEKELFTKEDIIKAIAVGYDWCHQKHIPSESMINNFIEQLKQKQ